MHLRYTIAALLAATTLAAPLAAQNVMLSGSGSYSGFDDFTFAFLLPQTPTSVTDQGTGFQLVNQPGTISYGGGTFNVLYDLTFNTHFYCGGFIMAMHDSGNITSACGDGSAQMFTGTTAAPTFVSGSYENLANYDQSLGAGVYSATISDITTTTTPEPGSVALLATGLIGLVPMARRREKK